MALIFKSADVATLMNAALANTMGTTTAAGDGATSDGLICTENLSNFVQCGMTVANNLTLDNFYNTVTNMLETVGAIYYENLTADEFDENLFGLRVNSTEFAILREKVRINHVKFEAAFIDDKDASSTFDDLFKKHPMTFEVKVWGNKGFYRTKPFTISYEMFKTSVQNLEAYNALIAEMWAVIEAVVKIAVCESPMFLIRQQAANCCLYRPGVRVIDLAAEFTNAGGTYTSTDDPAFAKWFVKWQRHLNRAMSYPTTKFGGKANYPINTPKRYRKKFLLDTFYDDINDGLSGVYHDNKIGNIDEYELLTFLENINEPNKIDVVPADPPVLTLGKHVTRVQISDIVGMIWDSRGTFWTMNYRDVADNPNRFDKHVNYISTVGASHCVDHDSNAIIFVVHDKTAATKAYTITEESDESDSNSESGSDSET